MPIASDSISEAKASSSVAGKRSRISSIAGSLETKHRPKSPCRASFSEQQVLLPQRQVEAERLRDRLALELGRRRG